MLKDELLNIVALIVRHMSEEGRDGMMGRTIIDGLMDEGYDPVEIDDALSWFESIPDSVRDLDGVEFWEGFKGVRVQSPVEREALTHEAFAYLSRLKRAGVIEDGLCEVVLDKVYELSIPGFGLDEMKALLGLVLYARGSSGSEDVFYMLGESGRGSCNG